jgi:pimeloyl-ACP methyl ester carboxylesterase
MTATLVLIHGLWLTPRSWEHFVRYFRSAGYRVLAPAWPRMCGEVEEVRRDRRALEGLGLAEVIAHYESIVRGLDAAPILIGHCFGGLVCQVLLDRGWGRAGVAIDSAAPRGVWRLPLSTLRAAGPLLANPLNCVRTVALTFEQFRYAFANTMDAAGARRAYERYAVPGPARPLFEAALANLDRFAVTRVDFRNHRRAPLLLLAGGEDHLVPASVVRENHACYARSNALTAFHAFPGRSHLVAQPGGWREVAVFIAQWLADRGPNVQGAPRIGNTRPPPGAIMRSLGKEMAWPP